jgi:hypothetical protein
MLRPFAARRSFSDKPEHKGRLRPSGNPNALDRIGHIRSRSTDVNPFVVATDQAGRVYVADTNGGTGDRIPITDPEQ